MAAAKLTEMIDEQEFQDLVSKVKIHDASSGEFNSPKKVRRDMTEQKGKHRDILLKNVQRLTWASFFFLVAVVATQMCVRLFNDSYSGISDTALNILTIGVFGEVIGVVAVIAFRVWQD